MKFRRKPDILEKIKMKKERAKLILQINETLKNKEKE